MRGNDSTMLGLSSDEKFLFLQNATPATSVTVVDMGAKKLASEIPMPGCFGIYPAATAANKFVALCGDGTAATVTVDAKGSSTGITRSSAFFDADTDPLFPKAARDGDTLYFASFNGLIYKVDISGATAQLVEKYSIVDGVPGEWKPASENLLAYAPAGKVLFISMFPNSKDGDHRVNATQIWSVDVASKTVLSRSTVNATNGFAYSQMAGSGPDRQQPRRRRGREIHRAAEGRLLALLRQAVGRRERLQYRGPLMESGGALRRR